MFEQFSVVGLSATNEASDDLPLALRFSPKIAVIGLGYVGLPLAVSLAKHFPVLGFDINQTRIQELKENYDRTGEIAKDQLQNSTLQRSYQVDDLANLAALPSLSSSSSLNLDFLTDLQNNGLPENRSNTQNNTGITSGISESIASELTSGMTARITEKVITAENLSHNKQHKSSAEEEKNQLVYIVTVPTPVTDDNMPDLTPLKKASETVARILQKGSIVVYESTVYPGITEEYCGPILEKISGLKAGKDFYLGYSPERINPGDREHTLERITKVVSGQTDEIAKKLEYIYGKVNNGNIFVAKNIKTAEAAKVIENAQRDINIAFINEITNIMGKLGLSIYDVLAAAETKWNFLKFKPGLVGGHCIGVDPYYLAECARQLGHEPEVILSGRRTNENMGRFIANSLHQSLIKQGISNQYNSNGGDDSRNTKEGDKSSIQARILLLGLTFKEDTSDLRNTKVVDVLQALRQFGYIVDVHDPKALPEEAITHLNEKLLPSLDGIAPYDCILGAVPHKEYLKLSGDTFKKLLKPRSILADLKNMWPHVKLPEGIHYWTL